MERKDLVSIIVPCYNVEKYLEQCVESLVNQTIDNYEILLIDDGSLDQTPKMCDSFANITKRMVDYVMLEIMELKKRLVNI